MQKAKSKKEEAVTSSLAAAAVHPYAHLPIVDVPNLEPNALAKQNPYEPFDSHVVFYDNVPNDVKLPRGTKREHVYLVNGMPYRGSCTGFLHEFFSDFDGDAVVEKVVGNWKWHNDPKYHYYQRTKEEILLEWKNANKLGSRFHYCVELFFNGLEQPTHPDFQTKEYGYFQNFYRDFVVGKLKPWRTEWIVFDRLFELVGSIDMIFQRVDSDNPYSLVLYDWKRCLTIDATAYQDESAKGPFRGLPKAKFWQYSLQLNMYKYIIERCTQYRVEEMVLLRCHPQSDNYERIVVPDLQGYILRAVEERFRKIMQLDLDLLSNELESQGKKKEEEEEEEKVLEISIPDLVNRIRLRYQDFNAQIDKNALSPPTLQAPMLKKGGEDEEGESVEPFAKKAKKETFCSRCTREVDEEQQKAEEEEEDEEKDPRYSYTFSDEKTTSTFKKTASSSSSTSSTKGYSGNSNYGSRNAGEKEERGGGSNYFRGRGGRGRGFSSWKQNEFDGESRGGSSKKEEDTRFTYVFDS